MCYLFFCILNKKLKNHCYILKLILRILYRIYCNILIRNNNSIYLRLAQITKFPFKNLIIWWNSIKIFQSNLLDFRRYILRVKFRINLGNIYRWAPMIFRETIYHSRYLTRHRNAFFLHKSFDLSALKFKNNPQSPVFFPP